MTILRTSVVLCAVAVVAGGCQVLNYTWVTPPAVAAGSTFVMELTGRTDDLPGPAGVVFQVPNGFTVLGAAVVLPNFSSTPDLVRDEAALLAIYTPDPGHHLASFSGMAQLVQVPHIDVHLQVFVQAPPAAGAFQLEMALACEGGPWLPQLGLSSFQAPGGAEVRQLQVTATPPAPPFTLAAGLFDVPPRDVLDLEAADIDGDGRDDLVEMGISGFRVRRSLVTGFVLSGAPYVTSGTIRDAAVADFDGDGFADVALSNGTVAFGNGGTAWTTVLVASHSMTDPAVAAGDFDGDGLADVAFADVQKVLVRRGQTDRSFAPWSTGLPSVPAIGTPGVLVAVDLDNDGRAELIRNRPPHMSGLGASVFASTPQGVWNVVGTLPPSHHVLAIDVDGNGSRELLPGATGQLFTYSSQGLTGSSFAGPATPFMRAVAVDHDRDGLDDMVLGVAGGTIAVPRMELWRNAGGGVFTAVPLANSDGFRVLRAFTLLVAGDFDDDTFPDLGAAIDRVLLWRNTHHGAAAFGEGCAAPGGTVPMFDVLGTLGSGLPATLQVSGVAPGAAMLLWLGNSRTFWNGAPVLPLDLGLAGAPGCTLLAEPIELFAVQADAGGVATLPFQVPLLPPAIPISIFGQTAVLDATANPLGGVFSRGIVLKLQ